jgi:hypothetical protein
LVTLQESGIEIPVASSADGEVDRSNGLLAPRTQKVGMGRSVSPAWHEFGTRSEDEQEAVGTRLSQSVTR